MSTPSSVRVPARIAAAATIAFIASVSADDLFSNASPDPAVPALGASPATLSGVPAPAGAAWSEAPAQGAECNAVAGFSTHATEDGQFRFADDFVVPAEGWILHTATFYAYIPGAAGPPSPIAGINVRIWSGRPGDPGSAIVFGDGTSRMIESVSTLTYRVFNSVTQPLPMAPDTSRLIWATSAEIGGLHLAEGHYWIDWQYELTNADSPAYSPAATNPGTRGDGNAIQLRAPAGAFPGGWTAILDEGKPAQAWDQPQDLPFILRGVITPPCDPDVNCDGVPDQGDVACIILAVAGDTSCFCQADPDFNRDGVPDQGDVADVILSVAGAPCP